MLFKGPVEDGCNRRFVHFASGVVKRLAGLVEDNNVRYVALIILLHERLLRRRAF